jgi:RNA polymerase primary sigma factor
LIDAANRFDPTLGFKFISYSVWWIRKYITESLTNDGRTVRIPANKVNQLAKLTKKCPH